MADQSNKPSIRFAGFTDPWEQRKFSEFVTAAGIRNSEGLNLRSFSVSNDRGFIPQDEQFENGGTMAEADKRAYWIVRPESFAYNPARINVGSIGYLPSGESVIVSSLYEVFQADQTADNRFLWHWFKSPRFTRQIELYQEGGVRLYFFFDKLLLSTIVMPSIEEQKSISYFFDQLDDLITLHQRKYDKLVVFKKAMLEQMFPQEGETVPMIRFAGFTDPWEQRKFGDIAARVSEMSCSPDLRRVEYEDINAGQGTLNKDLHEKVCSKTGIRFEPGDVLYGKLRPYLQNWLFARFSGIAVGDFWVLRSKDDVDGLYLYSLIQSAGFDVIANQSTGSKMPRADWQLVSNTTFWVPPHIDEQQIIGEYLLSLDSLITLHQRKLELLQNIKKSLLDEMFV